MKSVLNLSLLVAAILSAPAHAQQSDEPAEAAAVYKCVVTKEYSYCVIVWAPNGVDPEVINMPQVLAAQEAAAGEAYATNYPKQQCPGCCHLVGKNGDVVYVECR